MLRKCLPYRQLLASCLGLSFAVGVNPGIAMAAPAPAKVGSASYDVSRMVISIPVHGVTPSVQVRRIAPCQYIADLPHCVLERSEVQGQWLPNGLVAGWSLDEMPVGDTVRLRLTLNADVQPQLRVTHQGNAVVLALAGEPLLASRNAEVKAAKPVLPPVVTQHAAPRAWKTAPTAVAFPTAAPAPLPHFMGPLPGDARLGDRPVMVSTLVPPHHVKHAVAHLAAASRHALAHLAHLDVHALVAPRNFYPLMLGNRPMPASVAMIAPRVPAGLAFPALAAAPVSHPLAHAPATLGAAHYDAQRGYLVVPVAGNVDPNRLAVVHLNKRWAYLDVPGSHPTFTGVRYQERQDKLFQRWVMAKRPNSETTRLSFALGSSADIDVKVVGHQLLVAVHPQQDLVASHVHAASVAAKPAASATGVATANSVIQNKVVTLRSEVTAAKTAVDKALPALAAVPVSTAPVAKPVAKPLALVRTPIRGLSAAMTALGRPYFDQERYGLVIPFRGKTPRFRLDAMGDRFATIEVKGSLLPTGRLMQSFRHHPVMASWQAERAKGVVKVALSFRQPADVVVAADSVRQQLLLIPQPRLAALPAPVAAAPDVPTILSAAKLPADGRHLFIPFQGPVPAYTIEQIGDTFAYIDFPAAKLDSRAVQFFAPEFHPTLDYWLLSQRAERGVRLALALTQSGGPAVFQDRTNQRLVIELGDAAPMIGARTETKVPAIWPGEQRPTGYRPVDPLIKVSRKAS